MNGQKHLVIKFFSNLLIVTFHEFLVRLMKNFPSILCTYVQYYLLSIESSDISRALCWGLDEDHILATGLSMCTHFGSWIHNSMNNHHNHSTNWNNYIVITWHMNMYWWNLKWRITWWIIICKWFCGKYNWHYIASIRMFR